MKAVTIMLSASVVVKYAKVQLTSLNGEDLSVMRRRDTPRAQRSSDEVRTWPTLLDKRSPNDATKSRHGTSITIHNVIPTMRPLKMMIHRQTCC